MLCLSVCLLCRDAKNLKWRPIPKYPNASERDLSELITEISDPRSAQLQTFLMVARLSPLTLSASEASYRQVKKLDLFFHILLLSANQFSSTGKWNKKARAKTRGARARRRTGYESSRYELLEANLLVSDLFCV